MKETIQIGDRKVTFVVDDNLNEPGTVNMSANQHESYENMHNFMQNLCEVLEEEHKHKLQTYGFLRKYIYLCSFHIKNFLFRIRNRDLFK